MDYVILFAVTLIIGVAIGGALGWIITHLYSKERMARLQAQHDSDTEKIAWTEESERRLRETFEVLASRSLKDNAADFSQRINEQMGTQLGAHAGQIGLIKTALETN